MPRLTPEQLRAAKEAKREKIRRSIAATILGDQDIDAPIQEIDEIVIELIESALWYWFFELLPKHFGPGATKTYGYVDRTQGYMVAKFTGKIHGSQFRFPKAVAYRMASYQSPGKGRAPDPYPLQATGRSRTQMTTAPAKPPYARVTARGYVGEIIIALPPFIRRVDIDALLRDSPNDLFEMGEIVSQGLNQVFASNA